MAEHMENLNAIITSIIKQTEKTTQDLKAEYEEFKKKRDEFDAKQRELATKNCIKENVIELNVGGRHFTTLKSTLQKPGGSMLAALFSGRYDPGVKDKDGRYFIDRPSKPFELILNALRTDSPLQIPDDEYLERQLMNEIKYYHLEDYFKEELKEPTFKGGKLMSNKWARIVNKWIQESMNDKKKRNWVLCYQASRDGFDSNAFHSRCDNQGPTVVVIQSTGGYIFGGYVPTGWRSAQGYVYDSRTFLFSLKNPAGTKPEKLPNTGPSAGTSYSIYDYSSYGPTFGGGHDIYISSNSNQNTSSYTNLGHSFTCPGQTYGSIGAKNYFTGSYNFQTSEIEVYKLKKRV